MSVKYTDMAKKNMGAYVSVHLLYLFQGMYISTDIRFKAVVLFNMTTLLVLALAVLMRELTDLQGLSLQLMPFVYFVYPSTSLGHFYCL